MDEAIKVGAVVTVYFHSYGVAVDMEVVEEKEDTWVVDSLYEGNSLEFRKDNLKCTTESCSIFTVCHSDPIDI